MIHSHQTTGDFPLHTGSEEAKPYFLSRGGVVFLSYCRFWERHPFVQQSLARQLVSWGIPVTWLDGSGWRKYEPTFYWNSARLQVLQLPELPARRFTWVQNCNSKLQGLWIRRLIEKQKRPLIWVQAGLSEGLEAELPYVDIYSVFDDPYRHDPESLLCKKAKMIICQNDFAYQKFKKVHPAKTFKLLPPVDAAPGTLIRAEFPTLERSRTMGYVGSFFSHDFDLALFESFVRNLPDWKFILAGRTDNRGLETVKRLSLEPNFWYRPWVDPFRAKSIWKQICVGLLLYKNNPIQHGAFPIKVLEATQVGVHCIGTDVPKNQDLRPIFPLSNDSAELMRIARNLSEKPLGPEVGNYFLTRMSPDEHLRVIAQFFNREGTSERQSKAS